MAMNVRYRLAARRFDSFAEGMLLFFVGVALVGAWVAAAVFHGAGGSWQLILSTTTTLVTFLMVFVVYARQKRDSRVLERKLDRLLRRNYPILTDIAPDLVELPR
jgi:low affinity Fe/Cu permease